MARGRMRGWAGVSSSAGGVAFASLGIATPRQKVIQAGAKPCATRLSRRVETNEETHWKCSALKPSGPGAEWRSRDQIFRAKIGSISSTMGEGDECVGLEACCEAGRMRAEGKEYVVADGDIMEFLTSA